MDHDFYSLSPTERIALTTTARESFEPLMLRWGEVQPDFGDRWVLRASAAAMALTGATSIADLGCGSMTLARYLKPDQSYIPVDVARRDEATIVLDLNKDDDLKRLPAADACALLGVLEYSYRPRELIKALGCHYGQIVATYNPWDGHSALDPRLANGWVTNFRRADLLEVFSAADFNLRSEIALDTTGVQYLFDFQASRSR